MIKSNLTEQLGNLKKVDIREIWIHEAKDFTTWLAKDENLLLLGNEIGIPMNLINTEVGVGVFSADILAEEPNTGRKIVIENQLEQTDHDHFGKLFTYGSGLDASILIWICKQVREEHRQAIDWINLKTNNSLNVFAIQIEAWKIDNSKPAPKFQVICAPNDWAKLVKDSSKTDNKLSATNLTQLDFWTEFNTFMSDNTNNFNPRKPRPQHWYDISIGNSQAYISLTVSFQKNFIRCTLYIPDNKDLFRKLYNEKDKIENDIGQKLEWNELPKAKASTISISKDRAKVKDIDNWKESFEWYKNIIPQFSNVFARFINDTTA
ncbi:hypothetical protein X793_05605 [Dehalococcoides mccartyi CG4]|uniref:DUF4268 domain-containing protein n=1 Tax=Dehalococcoides mccartyi TaxID=61435 RepID=UPI0004E034B3|nr:DUF4268 domain-containing protein [Dehalococcoides mccartyi]AII59785.1 hypothetical protein X793_05605 [Dehalococcoides mccartyi CG4]